MSEYKHEEITGQIINAAHTVHNKLGYGFLEKVYHNSLVIELRKRGIFTERAWLLRSTTGILITLPLPVSGYPVSSRCTFPCGLGSVSAFQPLTEFTGCLHSGLLPKGANGLTPNGYSF